MGKTMAKANVIWGEQHSVSLAGFSSAHMAQIIDLIHKNVGPQVAIDHAAAQSAIVKAKNNPKMKNGYVKVGLIDGNLVLRAKEKKFLGDIEVDAILVRGYPAKVIAWDTQKTLDQMKKSADELARRQKAEREEAERKEKAARLNKVMNTPDQEGVTMRDKILRAADKAQKLGVGDYAKNKLKAQGLTPMDERYHGEAIDPKNRYGRYMPELRKLWEDHASSLSSFGKWLDDAEAGKTSVPGVREALALKKPDNEGGGPIIVRPDAQRGTKGGVAGGRVVYLDDEGRKPYVARVANGVVTGGQLGGTGDVIFVIGSDNKIYVGRKQRGTTGQVGAFNHSSFFSGGPVKSAGTLKLSGGKITEVYDLSGHYTPTKAMVVQAVRKFGGTNRDWLASVKVHVGNAPVITGAALLDEHHETESTEIWGKYSVGAMSREDAARVLMAGSDGNWLVRMGSNKKLVISFRKGGTVDQDLITTIGAKGLDRKKLLPPDQVRSLLQSLPSTPPKRTAQESESREAESQEKPRARRATNAPRRPTQESEGKESESQEKPRSRQQTNAPQRQTPPPTQGLDASLNDAMRAKKGWRGDLNRAGAEALLKDKPGAWLLREGRDGIIAFSYNDDGQLRHVLINNMKNYTDMQNYAAKFADRVIA